MTLRDQLLELAEPAYRNFIMPLMPGVEHVIGIRLPLLRRLAREIVHGDWRAWLTEACPLDDRTYNKSLQKIVGSLRVDATTKEEVRALKRGAEKRRGRRTFAK